MTPHEFTTTVLIVDDTPANLNLLSEMLLARGYVVKVATNGRRALSVAEQEPPDLVMLDVDMPEMDGFEVCRRLKASERTREVPVIFLSALDDTADKVHAFAQGGVDYVTKPFHVEEVIARVDTQLRIARLQRELARQNAELTRKNEELVREQHRTGLAFAAFADLLAGRVLDGKYRVDEKIGSGGFGTVYRGMHLPLDRPVAIKIFRPCPGSDGAAGLERFRREGVAACRLDHPNVVTVYDSGVTDASIAYLVMELLEGRSLGAEIRASGKLSVARAIDVAIPVCRVLAAAASQSLVHRDIKPDNVFLHRGRDGEVVKVVDFGIAKLLEEDPTGNRDLTLSGAVVGSPAYMAPERLLGAFDDPRSDVYSVGVVLYQALSGKLPFERGSGGFTSLAITSITRDAAPLRSLRADVPRALESLVMRAMEKQPENRPTAAEMVEELVLVGKRASDVAPASDADPVSATTLVEGPPERGQL